MQFYTYIILAALGFPEMVQGRFMGLGRRTPREYGICFEPMDCLIVRLPYSSNFKEITTYTQSITS